MFNFDNFDLDNTVLLVLIFGLAMHNTHGKCWYYTLDNLVILWIIQASEQEYLIILL
jgi:hypothetical protein